MIQSQGYTVCHEPDPGLPGPYVTYEKDDVFLALYPNNTAQFYTSVKRVYMWVGPFRWPCTEPQFAHWEGLIVAAKLGAESLLGVGT